MPDKLKVIDSRHVPKEIQQEVERNIEKYVITIKDNRQVLNRLTFDCITALTEAEDTKRILSNKKGISRIIGSITGSNKKMQDTINKDTNIAQWASQQILQKLVEQNLMTFDLIAAVNNKLNTQISTVSKILRKFFIHNRSEIARIESKINVLEKSVNLLTWQSGIRYRVVDDEEYVNMDTTKKIVFLVREFYDITRGKWSNSDLLLLQNAMSQIDLSPKVKVNYFTVVKEISNNEALQDKLLDGATIGIIDDPSYLVSMGTLKKLDSLGTDEKYLVDTMYESIREVDESVDWNTLRDNMVKKYISQQAQVNINTDVEAYDLILDFLYNLRQAVDESILIYPKRVSDTQEISTKSDSPEQSIDSESQEKELREAEQLFLDYKLDEAFEKFQKLAEAGNGRAMYFLGEYYANGIDENIEKDKRKGLEWRKKGAEAGDELASLNVAYSLPKIARERNEIFKQWFNQVLELAESGDVFAQYEVGDLYWYGRGINEDEATALQWYQESAEQGFWRGAQKLEKIYFEKKEYDKALKWSQKSSMGVTMDILSMASELLNRR